MISPRPDQSGRRKKRKPPARAIAQWLDFIRPHLDRYAQAGRGEQKKYIDDLSKMVGTGVDTLRRFIWAAQFLESHRITQFPPGIQRMPLASVEVIMRISKRDPVYLANCSPN